MLLAMSPWIERRARGAVVNVRVGATLVFVVGKFGGRSLTLRVGGGVKVKGRSGWSTKAIESKMKTLVDS